MSDKVIKLGSRVMWRGAWGSEEPKEAKVEGIEETEEPHSKYGTEVAFIDFDNRECSVLELDNGHWCYGDQIDEVLD
jgi:hypothetical protein